MRLPLAPVPCIPPPGTRTRPLASRAFPIHLPGNNLDVRRHLLLSSEQKNRQTNESTAAKATVNDGEKEQSEKGRMMFGLKSIV